MAPTLLLLPLLGAVVVCCSAGGADAAAQQQLVPAAVSLSAPSRGCLSTTPDGTRCLTCAGGWELLASGACRRSSGGGGGAPATAAAAPPPAVDCADKCGQAFISDGAGGRCSCDYWCVNAGDCCGGAASKNRLCPQQRPTLSKARIGSCAATQATGTPYAPAMCWCDGSCSALAPDCCSDARGLRAARAAGVDLAADADVAAATAALAAEDATELGVELAAEAAAAAAAAAAKAGGRHASDCGQTRRPPRAPGTISAASVAAAAVHPGSSGGGGGGGIVSELETEKLLLACQAADRGVPATPIRIPLYWTAGQVCRQVPSSPRRRGGNSDRSSSSSSASPSRQCVGGAYGPGVVRQQVDFLNHVYRRAGIQFDWDGVIRRAAAPSAAAIAPCETADGAGCFICGVQRRGGPAAINVVTSPSHILGDSLGVTQFYAWVLAGERPACGDWVFAYERTLPGLGGRSLVDGQLSDSGSVLAHEIGHQLQLHHTWFEELDAFGRAAGATGQQCRLSASIDPADIVAARSDGVRDTPAQALNSTNNPVTKILRFIGCDVATGAYTNTTANAQQSCTSASGFPQGDSYYNNYNNLMSYGDKTCLRTLTPGQGARARCAYKCLRKREPCV